jgi:hypothetical protein
MNGGNKKKVGQEEGGFPSPLHQESFTLLISQGRSVAKKYAGYGE